MQKKQLFPGFKTLGTQKLLYKGSTSISGTKACKEDSEALSKKNGITWREEGLLKM